ncbi:MAG: tetratricopeptide repeat protein [Flavobacteriaceae bacterium]|nr:tetratricopeptide repeat protein [Flavobacteriaceae bacterium]
MRKQLFVITLLSATITFAQKNEIKAIEKAIKSGNFVSAQTEATNAASVMEGADAKTQAKYYFLKGKAFLGNGNIFNMKNIQTASTSFEKSNELSNNKYTTETNGLMAGVATNIQSKAMEDYNNSQYKAAADKFQAIYSLNGDQQLLFFAAQTYVQAKDYQNALKSYLELDKINYTGEGEELIATDKATGEIKVYGDKLQRTLDLKAGTHTNPKTRQKPSQRPTILKKIAQIYVELKDNDNAIKAIQRAKTENPSDANMLVSEANIYYAQGDNEKFKSTLMKAAELEPNNFDVINNIAIVSKDNKDYETAESFFNKALKIKEDDLGANVNLAVMFIDQVTEMRKQLRDIDDDNEYDAMKEKIDLTRRKALPLLEKAHTLQPNDEGILTALYNLYAFLKMSDKKAEVDAKLQKLGGQ